MTPEAEAIVKQVYDRRGYLFEWQVLLAEHHPQFLLGYDQAYQAATNLEEDGSLPRKYRECVYVGVLSAMGHTNPFFERAGFVRVGVVRKTGRANGAYATRRRLSAETEAKSRYSEPVYYVFDNRGRISRATSEG